MDLWKELGDRVKALAGSWTAYTAVGSFALYVLGYLSLRFHLTALGVGTDLAVLDERYLFTGARFLVFFVTAVPKVALLALAVAAVLGGLSWAVLAVLPASLGDRLRNWTDGRGEKIKTWWAQPGRLALAGIVLSVVMIQTVMIQCVGFANLLVADRLPEPAWLHPLLLPGMPGSRAALIRTLHFPALVAGALAGAWLLWAAQSVDQPTALSRFFTALLAFLVAVQVLLLPVNYGVLYVDKTLPRVADLGGKETLEPGQTAWLIWEGKEGVTYLVRDGRSDVHHPRALTTLLKKDVTRTAIVGYDDIFCKLFGSAQSCSGR